MLFTATFSLAQAPVDITYNVAGNLNANALNQPAINAAPKECIIDFHFSAPTVRVVMESLNVDEDQGVVVLNNATIEHAIVGVTLQEPGYANTGGGVIYAHNGTTFNNCFKSVAFYPYTYQNNLSSFQSVNFLCDAPLRSLAFNGNGSGQMVTLWDTYGVLFRNCTFDFDYDNANTVPTSASSNFNVIVDDCVMDVSDPTCAALCTTPPCWDTERQASQASWFGKLDDLETLETNIDGGETQLMLDTIADGTTNDNTLKAVLIAHSPLSDAVIDAYVLRSGVTESNFVNVMLANMPVSHSVWENMQTKLNGLGVKNQLKFGNNFWSGLRCCPAVLGPCAWHCPRYADLFGHR